MPTRSNERAPLTKQAITAAALDLIDRDGLEQLSMRKLGNSLGYEAMALYKHIPDKQAVIDAAVASALEAVELPDPTAPWHERLRRIARGLRGAALKHPHLLVPMMTNPPPTPAVIERIDASLAALRDSGATDDDVTHHFWLFINATTGALLAEARSLIAPPAEAAAIDDDTAARLEECRALSHFGPALASCDFADEFERLLDTVIANIS